MARGATLANTELSPDDCPVRDVLNRIGDKWSVLVLHLLSEHTKRFTELRNDIDGISQRMLTVTLRGLERDGVSFAKRPFAIGGTCGVEGHLAACSICVIGAV